MRTRRFKPGFVVRDGGLMLPAEAGLEAGWPSEISSEVEGAGGAEGVGAGASPAAISAIASSGRRRSGRCRVTEEVRFASLWAGTAVDCLTGGDGGIRAANPVGCSSCFEAQSKRPHAR